MGIFRLLLLQDHVKLVKMAEKFYTVTDGTRTLTAYLAVIWRRYINSDKP